jgi:hypothetical protein
MQNVITTKFTSSACQQNRLASLLQENLDNGTASNAKEKRAKEWAAVLIITSRPSAALTLTGYI